MFLTAEDICYHDCCTESLFVCRDLCSLMHSFLDDRSAPGFVGVTCKVGSQYTKGFAGCRRPSVRLNEAASN